MTFDLNYWKKSGITSVLQASGMVLGLLISIVTARWLGPKEKGYVDAFISLNALIAQVAGISLGPSIMVCLTGNYAPENVTRILHSQFRILLMILFVILVGIISGPAFGFSSYAGVLLSDLILFGLPILASAIFLQNISAITSTIDSPSKVQLALGIGKFFSLIGTIICWCLDAKQFWAFLLNFLSLAIAAAIIYRGIKPSNDSMKFYCKETSKRLIKNGLKMHLTTVANILAATVCPLILAYNHDSSQVAYFTIGYQLFVAQSIIPQAATAVSLKSVLSEPAFTTWKKQRKNLSILFLIMALISMLCYTFSPFVIGLLFGKKFEPANDIFRALIPLSLITTLLLALQPFWIKLDMLRLQAVTALVGSISLTILSILLIPKMGTDGAIISIASSMILSVLMHLPLVRKLEDSVKMSH